MSNEIRVPTLGESVTEATIGQWFKKPGEAISADEPLVELETDKVTVEVPLLQRASWAKYSSRKATRLKLVRCLEPWLKVTALPLQNRQRRKNLLQPRLHLPARKPAVAGLRLLPPHRLPPRCWLKTACRLTRSQAPASAVRY